MNTPFAMLLSGLLLGAACAASAAPSNALLIVPGHRIGHTLLGADGARTLAALPNPYRSDAGMSQRCYVWVFPVAHGKPHTLFIHAVANGTLNVKPLSGLTVDTIRVTSPRFATQNGLHTGSTLAQIRRQFPHLRSANTAHTLYDDKSRGIAFEFVHRPAANSRAIAVTVHTPGQSAATAASPVNELDASSSLSFSLPSSYCTPWPNV